MDAGERESNSRIPCNGGIAKGIVGLQLVDDQDMVVNHRIGLVDQPVDARCRQEDDVPGEGRHEA